MRSRKGNVVTALMVIVLVLALFLALTKHSPSYVVHEDPTQQAVAESDLAVRKSVYNGVSRALREGLGTSSKVWFCNQPIPPTVGEANASLSRETNQLLEQYFNELRAGGYYEDFDNLSYSILMPFEGTAMKKIPGYSVIITDLSGSMSFLMQGRRKDEIIREMNTILVDTVLNKTPGSKIALVVYSAGGDLAQPLTTHRDQLVHAINRMRAPDEGVTCIACGIYKAVEELVPPPPPAQKPSERPLSIVLMTDGGANECHETSAIRPECRLLDYPASQGCGRDQARAQAIEYARQAHDRYGIDFYGVIMATDYCPPLVTPTDCYDPTTMCSVVQAGSSCTDCATCPQYAEGRNPDELQKIYQEYGEKVARVFYRNLTYMKLENDIIRASAPRVSAGLDYEDLKTQQDFTADYLWGFKTWWLYKNLMNWMLFNGDMLLEHSSLKQYLTSYKACQGVFLNASYGGCPSPGNRHIGREKLQSMELTRRDLRPVAVLDEIETTLNKGLNGTNITCAAEYVTFNITNMPIFDYRSGPPVNLPMNTAFGNGTFRQSGDGVSSVADCPATGPGGREVLLWTSIPPPGTIGPNKPVSQCAAGRSYEYVGMDRRLISDIVVRCRDDSIGMIMDGLTRFEPLTLEFIIRVDMMSDCDPPDDVVTANLVC